MPKMISHKELQRHTTKAEKVTVKKESRQREALEKGLGAGVRAG